MPLINYQNSEETPESDVKWIEESNSVLTALEHDLKGEDSFINKKQEVVWEQSGEPLMNDLGIRFVISSLRHIMNKNTFFSTLQPKRISDLCFETERSICTALFLKDKDYAIAPEYFDIIVTKISNIIELSLRRAELGGDKKAITSMTQSITRQYLHPDPEEKEDKGFKYFKR